MRSHGSGSLQPPVSSHDHSLGPADAPLTLVEYGDFECPHCRRAHPIVAAVRAQLGARLRFVFRNFPLTETHRHALHAAEAAESVAVYAGEAAYWLMFDSLFEHQQDSPDALDDAHLVRYASEAGASAERVQAALDAHTFEAQVRSDFISGVRSGVNGTPTFFVNDERFDGDWTDVTSFASALKAELALTQRA
jgi:protein-disulfide isomerase